MQVTHSELGSDAREASHGSGATLVRRGRTMPAPRARHVNVHSVERLASALAGGWVVAWGASRRSLAGAAAAAVGGGLIYRGVSGHCSVYQALHVDTAQDGARALLPKALARPRHFEVLREVTIQKPAEAIYAAWKKPEVLTRAMQHLAEVEPLSGGRLRWTLRDGLGHAHGFEMEPADDVPNQRILLRSADPRSALKACILKLREAPGDRGTEVTLHLHFERPSGLLGGLLERVLGPVPSLAARRALENLKSLLEAGELPSLEKNPAARALGGE